MNIFLNEFSKEFAQYRVIMGMDNAAWHDKNKIIDNIVPLFIPPYSPEVNPAEHIWEYIRETGGFKNKTFNTMKEVEERLVHTVNSLLTDKETVKSITGFKWILKAI